jgi:hypothetical protein
MEKLYLDKITKKYTKNFYSVFDLETIRSKVNGKEEMNPYACGYYDGKNFELFEGKECLNGFLKFYLQKENANKICYAHFGGKFDFLFVLDELIFKLNKGNKYQIIPIRIGSSIAQVEIRRGKNKWILRDTYKLLSFSLKDLTNNFKVKHIKGEFDHNKINWRNWKSLKKEWLPYLISDCKGLYEVVNTYEDYVYRNFGISLYSCLTIAQLSLTIFRKKFLKEKIPIYINKEEKIRQSYYGGRTEIFKRFGKNLKYYDVNSLYPYVMFNCDVPVGLPVKTNNFKLTDFGVAYANIEAPKDIKYPLLPHKIKVDNNSSKLVFPVGKWSGWYCSPELQKAKKLGYKIDIKTGYLFKRKKLFRGFVKCFYEIKKKAEKDSVDYILSKLSLNSLYGKFGQKRTKQKIFISPKKVANLTPMDIYGELNIFEKSVSSRSNFILPAISSFITCYSRLVLYKYIEEADKKGLNVYYCDTDSVMVDGELDTSPELGDLKLEEEIKEGIFLLPKMYALKLKNNYYFRCKGFPKGIFNYKNYEKALYDNDFCDFKFTNNNLGSGFESLKRNKKFVSIIKRCRRVISKYDKRTPINMVDTKPLVIDE